MNAQTIIERLKKHPGAIGQDYIGVVASYGKGAIVDDEGDKNDIIAIANTGDIDLDDEVVIPSGLDTSYFEANRQIFVDHEYSVDKAAGFLRSISKYPSPKDHKAWKVRIGLHDNAAGEAVKAIVKASGQIGLSIGFYPTDFGAPTDDERLQFEQEGKELNSVVRAGRWFELSFTALPCNVSCQGRMIGGDGKQLRILRALKEQGKVDDSTLRVLGLADRKIRVLTAGGTVTKRVSALS